jgi:glutathione S-transferase
MLILGHKGIAFRTVTLPTGTQGLVRVLGFSGGTVPALVLDGRRVQTNPALARFLDELQPDPPLFPSDAEQRREVEAAERWGDEVFQMLARRTTLAAGLHGPDALLAGGGDGRLGPLLWHRDAARMLGVRLVSRFVFDVNLETERELLRQLPDAVDRIDRWIDGGVLGGDELNAADYMIATSLALLMYRRDLRPEIEARPAGALAERVLPEPARSIAPRG